MMVVAAAALFIGWLLFLSYAALMKPSGPVNSQVVSRAQAAAASTPLAAELVVGPDGNPAPEVKVIEPYNGAAPAAGTELYVLNLSEAKGFEGPGQYLLLLNPDLGGRPIPVNGKDLRTYSVVGSLRSPGYEVPGNARPVIYKLNDTVKAQIRKLYP
jgi:hypothetical protein